MATGKQKSQSVALNILTGAVLAFNVACYVLFAEHFLTAVVTFVLTITANSGLLYTVMWFTLGDSTTKETKENPQSH